MKKPFVFAIDVVSACNLRCPSCAQGQQLPRQPRGLMSTSILDAILTKAQHECVLCGVRLFRWTEPLLHPQLDELVAVVNNHDTQCYLSSNLNTTNYGILAATLAARPHSLRISCSGFTQPVYQIGHKGGNINRVMNNMELVASWKHPSTHVHMLWHRYPHNEHEMPLMKEYCEELGFKFIPIEALWLPLEAVVEHWEGKTASPNKIPLIHPLNWHADMAAGRIEECRLQVQEMALDNEGRVQLCCGVYDHDRFNLGDYLTQSLADIQAKRFTHTFCDRCIKVGGHIYIGGHSHGPEPRLRHIARKVFHNLAWLLPHKTASKLSVTET